MLFARVHVHVHVLLLAKHNGVGNDSLLQLDQVFDARLCVGLKQRRIQCVMHSRYVQKRVLERVHRRRAKQIDVGDIERRAGGQRDGLIAAEATRLERDGRGAVDDRPWVGLGVLVVLGVRSERRRHLPVGAARVDVDAAGDGGGDDDIARGADAGGGDELVVHAVELGGSEHVM